ncbi:MAG: glycoside hydrolase [Anaerolineales bacterium]|nr:glycoside hydrolase [Anaerolineales bacterium]
MSSVKIAVIGGGSAYLPVFLSAIIEHADSFQGSQLVLMDLDDRYLDIIYRLGNQMARSTGAKIYIHKTQNRREAIDCADFVFTTFRPGSFEARALDEKIPLKYGVIGQETIGPGGFFMALRSAVVIREIVEEMEALAPKAFLINYTNPTNIITEAVVRFSSIKVIGLCDQSQGDKRRIAHALDFDVNRLNYEVCGLNHATWSTLFTIDGEDGIPILLEHAQNVLEDPEIPLPVKRMFKLLKWFHRVPNRYWQYYYFHDELVQEMQAAERCRAEEIMLQLPAYYAHYDEESRKSQPNVVKMRGGSKAFGDFAVEVIRAIVENSNVTLILNMPNQGAIPGFDEDRVVEVPCLVNKDGAKPISQDPLPRQGLGLIKMLAEYQALASRTAWNGTREDAIRALVANPLVLTLPKAEALFDELAAAHARYLPNRLITK